MSLPETFTGRVLCQEEDGLGRYAVSIRVTGQGVMAVTEDGRRFEFGYGNCRFELGGNSGRVIFCKQHDGRQTLHCNQWELLDALAENSSGLLVEEIRQLKAGHTKRRFFSAGTQIGILIVLGVLLVASYFGVMAGARMAVAALPFDFDVQIGEQALAGMDLGPEVNDPQVVGAVEELVARLAPHAGLQVPFEVTVIDSPELNAFALPGGKIVVYTGLIKKCHRPEQLAGVLAHEMIHVTHRHGLERIGQSLGVVLALEIVLGDAGELARYGSEMITVATVNSYSRAQETEADTEGVRMMTAAGISPEGLIELFELMQGELGSLGPLSWVGTHPDFADRIESIRATTAELPPAEAKPFEVDWEAVRARLQ